MSRINLCLGKPKANCKLIQLTRSSTTQKFVHYFGLVQFVRLPLSSLCLTCFFVSFLSPPPIPAVPCSNCFCATVGAWAFEPQCQVIKHNISMAGVRSSDNTRPINIISRLLLWVTLCAIHSPFPYRLPNAFPSLILSMMTKDDA